MAAIGGSRPRISLLGEFSLTCDDRVLISRYWRPRKARALLKLLALQPRHEIHREQVIEMLWPESSGEPGAVSLRKSVHYIRRACEGVPVIALTDANVALDPSVEVDLDEFRRAAAAARARPGDAAAAERALALYRGDLLPDDLYEDWTLVHRDGLRDEAQSLRLSLAAVYAGCGDHERAGGLLRAALEVDPAREDAHRALIDLYARTGARERAIRQFERYSAMVLELGLEPDPEIQRIAEQARTGSHAEAVRAAPEPLPVRYATTRDRVRIAYTTSGEGFPLVHLSNKPWNHLQMEWDIPEWRAWHQALGAGRYYVRYDGRSRGLSDADGGGIHTETEVADLEAVVDALGLDVFDIVSMMHSCMTAVTYAAVHPERVRRMVLWCPYATPSEMIDTGAAQLGMGLIKTDWNQFCEWAAAASIGISHDAEPLARMMKLASPDFVHSWHEEMLAADTVAGQLAHVQAETLACELPGAYIQPGIVRKFADAMPHARVVTMPSVGFLPLYDDIAPIITTFREFLDGTESESLSA